MSRERWEWRAARAAGPNEHTICVMSLAEVQKLWLAEVGQGRLTLHQARQVWARWKTGPHLAAGHAAALDDLWLLKRLVEDLGSFGHQVYYKAYSGVQHVIFKGYPGAREILNAPRYRATNPKVVQMGVGRAGALSRIRGGAVLTVVLVSAYRIFDYIMSDEQTLTRLVGTLATDLVKIGTSAAMASLATMFASGVPYAAAFAVGPLVVAIVAGVLTALLLERIDSEFALTDSLVAAMDDAVSRVKKEVNVWADGTARHFASGVRDTAEAAVREAREFVLRRLRHLFWPATF